MGIFDIIYEVINAPHEDRRLKACGLDFYVPKPFLQAALEQAHASARLASNFEVGMMRRDRERSKQRWHDNYLQACWIKTARGTKLENPCS